MVRVGPRVRRLWSIVAGGVALEGLLAATAIRCGFIVGVIVVTIAGMKLSLIVNRLEPGSDGSRFWSRARHCLGVWVLGYGERSRRLVRRALGLGSVVGFLVSSVVVGPVVTIAVLGVGARVDRRWLVIVASSVLFAVAWVGLYTGLWALLWRRFLG